MTMINKPEKESAMSLNYLLESLLKKLGGYYIILSILAAQLLALPGALLGGFTVQMSADFTREYISKTLGMSLSLILAANLILLVIAWLMTPNARRRLSGITNGTAHYLDSTLEFNAWKEISGLTWRYSIAAILITYFVDIFSSGVYYLQQHISTQEQFNYTMIGGLVSVLCVVILAALIIERLLIPARLILLPKGFQTQISAKRGARLAGKFIVLIPSLTIIAILMMAPVGLHNTIMALDKSENAINILANIQNQSFLIGIITLSMGIALAYLISRTISVPIKELVDTFEKIERGDLSQRARVTTTDEIAELTIHFNRMVAHLEDLQSTLEKQVYERTAQLKATNEVGSVASSILEPDELLKKVVNLITDRFGHYYSAIYLLDQSGNWAELMEATGDAGKVLKQNRHRIELENKGLITNAITNQQATIAGADGALVRSSNTLLPYTKSEIALPLIIGDRVLGALDVQSTHEGAFNPQDVDTLQGMANQVAIALENARLYQESQRNLQEIKSIQKQYLLEAWSKVPNMEKLVYSVGDGPGKNDRKIEIPLALRDQILGKILLQTEEDITPEERNFVDAVASQATIAMENARLVNESRQLANRERLVTEISNKIWTSTTVDGVMQTVIKELGRVLDTTRVVIELKSDENNE